MFRRSTLRHFCLLCAICAATPLAAQTEFALRKHFEGKQVTIKLDMPGDTSGVDVDPASEMPVEFPKVADRNRRYGVALERGQTVTVTQVKVKGKLIEFHLNGGGYGTLGDTWSEPSVPSSSSGESSRERSIRRQISSTSDPDRRRSLERELDRARRDRQRDSREANARAAQARIAKEQLVLEKRRHGGSRFNIHFRNGVPLESLTPELIRSALRDYVVFAE